MSQRCINRNVDYLYNLQINETEHQNHRLTWILAAQTLIFTGMCTLFDDNPSVVMFTLIVLVGILLSISAVYSVIVGEVSVGRVLDAWDDYSHVERDDMNVEIPHWVILAPSNVLRSPLQYLMFYKFAPCVFFAAWTTLLFSYIVRIDEIRNIVSSCNTLSKIAITVIVYFFVLFSVCVVTKFVSNYLRYQHVHEERNKKSLKKNKRDVCRQCCCCNCCDDYCAPCVQKIKYTSTCASVVGLRIYHILVDRFNGDWNSVPANVNKFVGGNIKGIISKLDYIKSKGFNAILLSPVFSTAAYHGYHTTDYETIERNFGGWAIFEELIKKAHENGIKVFCDFVPNHCHKDNNLFKDVVGNKNDKYRKWFYFDEGRKGGCVSYQNYPDIPKFNLYDVEAANYMIEIVKNLVCRGVDGIRIDHAIGVPFCFIEQLRNTIKSMNPNFFIFGEVCLSGLRDYSQVEFKNEERKRASINGENVQDDAQLDYKDVMDGVLDFEFMNIMITEAKNGRRFFGNTLLEERLKQHFYRYPSDYTPILFLDNHDTNRFMYYCDDDRSLLDEAVKFMQCLPYPSIVYYGTELYMCNKESIFNGVPNADLNVRQPMDWSKSK